ncbi:hypothetical protein VULLAG_LOCUS19680 [Vulpes lagopus]
MLAPLLHFEFCSPAVLSLCHGPQDGCVCHQEKERPTSSELLVLPDAGLRRALVPVLSQESGLPASLFVSCGVGVFFWHNPSDVA